MVIQLILIFFIGLAALATVQRAVRGAISPVEAAFWLCVWIAGAFVVWRPGFASLVAHSVGIGRGADLVIYSAVILLFWLVFRVFVKLDDLEKHITVLVRNAALRDFPKGIDEKAGNR